MLHRVSQPTEQYLVFRIDGIQYALPLASIREVLFASNLVNRGETGGGPARFRLSARGAEIPVVYLGRSKQLNPRNRVLVLDEPLAGILVDSVSRVETIGPSEQADGKIRLGGKWRSVLDTARLLAWALDHQTPNGS